MVLGFRQRCVQNQGILHQYVMDKMHQQHMLNARIDESRNFVKLEGEGGFNNFDVHNAEYPAQASDMYVNHLDVEAYNANVCEQMCF